MNPLGICILLHYYTGRIQPWGENGVSSGSGYGRSPASDNLIKHFIDEGVLKEVDGHGALTERGHAYVERLLATPMPTARVTWVFDEPEPEPPTGDEGWWPPMGAAERLAFEHWRNVQIAKMLDRWPNLTADPVHLRARDLAGGDPLP